MDKIRIDFFDILGYLIPGSALLLLAWVAADGAVQTPWQAYESVHKIDQRAALAGAFLAYIVGFMLHALGSSLYDLYCKRRGIFQHKVEAGALTVQDKWAMVRERGEKHIPVLERWYALRALAQNLAAVALIGVGACGYKWLWLAHWAWGLFALLLLGLCMLLLHRAAIFHRYLNLDLEAVLRQVKEGSFWSLGVGLWSSILPKTKDQPPKTKHATFPVFVSSIAGEMLNKHLNEMQQPVRFSVIETAHRGIRNALSQLSLLAGATDYTDRAAVALLKTQTQEVMALLEEHADTENKLILPLLEGKAPAGAVHDEEEHAEMHRQHEALLALLGQIAAPDFSAETARVLGRRFYQDLSLIHAAHLSHMIEEERGSQVMIWEHYTDDDLRQVHGKVLQKLDPDLRMAWMRYILPALPPAERERLMALQGK